MLTYGDGVPGVPLDCLLELSKDDDVLEVDPVAVGR